jgi:hypothetical protein
MHKYLIHKGMHPKDAEHVVINSGSGIADWFKKNKKTIMKVLSVGAAIAGSALGAYGAKKGYDKYDRYKYFRDNADESGYVNI